MSDIMVEVVYALPDQQTLLSVSVPQGASIEQAIVVSEIQKYHPQIDLSDISVGIFSKGAKLADRLNDGDRVEIYRALLGDPKEIRRLRAERAKAQSN